MRILDFGKCSPYGTAKGGEKFAKDLRKGVPGNFYLAQPAFIYIYIYIFIYTYINICTLYTVHTHGFYSGYKKG